MIGETHLARPSGPPRSVRAVATLVANLMTERYALPTPADKKKITVYSTSTARVTLRPRGVSTRTR